MSYKLQIPQIFKNVLYGQKNIFIKGDSNNKYGKDKFMYLCGKTNCNIKTNGISDRTDVGMVDKNTSFKNINLSSFRLDIDYIQEDIKGTFEKLLTGQMDLYIKPSPDNHSNEAKYLSICGDNICNGNKKKNISVSDDIRESLFYLEISKLTGNLLIDIQRTFLGKNIVRFRIRKNKSMVQNEDYGNYLGVCGKNSCNIDNVILTNNRNLSGFRLNIFHQIELECCKNIGNENLCNDYWGNISSKCDNKIIDYCSIPYNFDNKDCVCINSEISPSECFDKRCFDKNIYKTSKMKKYNCKNRYVKCGYYKYIDDNLKQNIINNNLLDKKCFPKEIKNYKYDIVLILRLLIIGIIILIIILGKININYT